MSPLAEFDVLPEVTGSPRARRLLRLLQAGGQETELLTFALMQAVAFANPFMNRGRNQVLTHGSRVTVIDEQLLAPVGLEDGRPVDDDDVSTGVELVDLLEV